MLPSRRGRRWILLASGVVVLLVGGYWLLNNIRADGGQRGWTAAFLAVAGLVFGLAQVVIAGLALRSTGSAPIVSVGLPETATSDGPGMTSLTAPELVAAHVRGRERGNGSWELKHPDTLDTRHELTCWTRYAERS